MQNVKIQRQQMPAACYRRFALLLILSLWCSPAFAQKAPDMGYIYPAGGGSSPDSLTNVNGVLYFRATDGVNGYELWKSDGSAAGTALVKDITPGSASSYRWAISSVRPSRASARTRVDVTGRTRRGAH